jgi:hypothetical protein
LSGLLAREREKHPYRTPVKTSYRSQLYWEAFKEVVPLSVQDEATRDYIRMRDDRKDALKKAKQQIKSFLLRKGKQYPEKGTSWTQKYRAWLKSM